jgi:hypothetical protein
LPRCRIGQRRERASRQRQQLQPRQANAWRHRGFLSSSCRVFSQRI